MFAGGHMRIWLDLLSVAGDVPSGEFKSARYFNLPLQSKRFPSNPVRPCNRGASSAPEQSGIALARVFVHCCASQE
jgi:hypothetical protein